ncbi:MAG: site-specific integrase [Deltaproteobacteria bacterium]|nr:site-specific integrase [Deltaproteobacteria bacterium]
MAIRKRTKYQGVYRRESQERKFKRRADICFDISYKLHGKKIWEKIGWLSEGYSEKLASDIRSERMRSIRHGKELPKQKQKIPFFRDIWTKYETWAEKNKTRGGRDDSSLYRNCLQGKIADKRLNEISSFDLERLKADLQKSEYAPATIKHCLVLVRQIYNKSVTWQLYDGSNPVKGVKMPTIQNQKTRFLSHKEAGKLLNTLKGKRTPDLYDMAFLSLYTGLRAGEIFNLKGNDLDFENGIIKIMDPKNKTTRHAYMTKAIKEMLELRKPDKQEGFVFPARNGKKIVAISRQFRLIVKKLKFNDGITDRRQQITFHSLRHTFASWLALQGESLITIKEMLGHKSTAMTERYSHLIPDHKRRAALALERGSLAAMAGDRAEAKGRRT